MTACRASAGLRLRTGFAAAIGALVAVNTAMAQGPIRLSPPNIIDRSPAPTAPTGEAPPAETQESPRGDADSAIIVSPTPALDIDGVGLIDETRGGLPETLWQGSKRAVVDRLIELIPAPSLSAPARALAERTLTTSGAAPDPGAEKPKASFVALRAERLMAMGRVAPAAGLARAVPRREDDAILSRVLLDSALIEYDNSGACQIVRRQIGKVETPYVQKALIFCQALAGEHARAQLGLSLLHEQSADDEAFIRLVHALGGDQRPITELPGRLTPLHLAMLRAARQQIPAGAVENAEPAVQRMIAQSPNTTLEVRLAAAERAEATGALPTEAFIQVLEAVSFNPDELGKALAQAEKAPPARALAAIYRVAKAQSVGIARAEALARGWQMARARGFYPSAARVTLPLLRELTPSQELAWFAGDAGRALLLGGYRDDAQRWYELARDEASAGGRTEQGEILLWPLLRLAGADVAAADSNVLATWRAVQEKRDAAQMPTRLAVLTAALEGLGDATDGSLAALLLAGDVGRQSVAIPHPALWLGRDGAASAGRVGETALFVLASMGPDGAAGTPPQTLIALIQALRAVGLEAEARAFALEAAIAAGV